MPSIRFYDRALMRLSRRDLLRLAASVGAAAVVLPRVTGRVVAKPIFSAYPFALGVASGDPLPDGVVLWTRLAPDPLNGGGMSTDAVDVSWEIAEDEAFDTVARTGTVVARPELGHSVHVEVDGLRPGRDYWYRFRAGSEVTPIARTKTAPAAGAPVDRLRFGVCGCCHWEDGYFTAYQRIAQEHFDFVFHTGDYIYEERADNGRSLTRIRRHQGPELFTLTDYRNRYAQYRTDRHLRAAHASAPFIMSWDDHEVSDDYAGSHDQRNTPPELFVLRRAAAYQAYYEAMPLRASALPRGVAMRIYRHMAFGNLVDLSVLDTRQWRSDQGCGDGNKSRCAEAADPKRTMLGADQERWLLENLANARATWTVIGQQVPTFAHDMVKVNPDGRFSMDRWDGYVAARSRLYSGLVNSRAPNPIVLSGDVHNHYGADLKMDFTNPQSPTVGVEFTNTSVTSGGDGTEVAGFWEQTKADNPHIRYHSSRRGYIAITATPKTMQADFRVLDRVTTADAPVRTGGSLVVEAGRPGSSSI
jgi:alkaline phosphatase D